MNKGFTLIELMIGLAFCGILAVIVMSCVGNGGTTSTSFGLTGTVQTRCIDGLKFTVADGQARQIYDQFGKGVPCN